jgi:hypothetical protein
MASVPLNGCLVFLAGVGQTRVKKFEELKRIPFFHACNFVTL